MNGGLKWKLLAGFLLVFAAGGITGAFVGASHAREMLFHPHPTKLSDRMRRHLHAQLHLSADQMTKISPIVDKAAAQLGEVQRSTGERVHEIFLQEHREMAPYLTDEQRAKLTEMETRSRPWQLFRGSRHSPAQTREL
jgi:uncharacterized cupredoxin-like copper-binding protein